MELHTPSSAPRDIVEERRFSAALAAPSNGASAPVVVSWQRTRGQPLVQRKRTFRAARTQTNREGHEFTRAKPRLIEFPGFSR